MSLVKLDHIGPSITLKFFKEYCLTTYGSVVYVYNYYTGELINRCRVFNRSKIHGIAIQNGKILIYGGRSINIIDMIQIINSSDKSKSEKLTNEWIIAGEFSFDNQLCYLLTSYNKVLIIDLDSTIKQVKGIYGERSILYSGSIKVTSIDVYISAGTVMGGVIIWDLFNENKIHNLLGHEGSIFHVILSSNLEYIASCSDDRSIKLWNMKSGELLSTGWGHTARIWSLKFYDNDKKLISVSEDCTCRSWSIINNQLVQSKNFEVHLNKNVWGVDIQEDEMIAATCGNDGRIKIIDLDDRKQNFDETCSFSLDEISRFGIQFEKNELIKGFCWFTFGIIVITSNGKILKYSFSTYSWEFLFEDKRFFNYSNTNGVGNIIIFSNNNCGLLLLKFDESGDLIIKKYYHFEDLQKTTTCLTLKYKNSILLTLESPNSKDPFKIITISPNDLAIESILNFNKPQNFVSSCIELFDNFIIVGSRFSTLTIFDLKNLKSEWTIRTISPGDTITSIKFIEKKKDTILFSITNRDGFYNIVCINFTKKCYDCIHSNKITKGFLEGAYFNNDGDYIIYGFKSNFFFMYNETKQFELFSELCGGSHRQWNLYQYDNEIPILCYMRASCLYIRKFYKSKFPQTLRNGIHGREIRDVSICKTITKNNEYLFVTGSEDTTLKFCKVDQQNGEVNVYWTQRKHASGLQRCSFINDKWLISSGAREELFLWEINNDFSRPYINLRQHLPPSSKNPDLRIMDFDVKFIKDTENFILATVYSDSTIKIWYYDISCNKFSLLIDGIYESCCLLNVSFIPMKDILVMVVTPTDGYLVIWDITKDLPFDLVDAELIYTCKQKPTKRLPNYHSRICVHQSSIKSFAWKLLNPDTFIIYTGGDDNGLGMTTFKIDSNKKIALYSKLFEQNAAASTITSLNLFNSQKHILITSVDQNTKVWDISENKFVLIDSKYTTNADTGASDVVDSKAGILALIAGVGLSCWKFS